MRYIPLTSDDKDAMFATVGIKTVDELFKQIPEEFLLKKPLTLPSVNGEMGLMAEMKKRSEVGETAMKRISFLGGGVYRHYIPAVISSLISRGEFLTAYTPYQPEASQGTLQALYEFQTYIALLSGMDVANASMYDGATATAEAVLMARRINKKGKIAYVSNALHPHYREVLKTYLKDTDIKIKEIPFDQKTGKTLFGSDILDKALCLVVGYPNYFGVIEDMKEISDARVRSGAILISVTTEALSLALLKPLGEFGVDIFVGEGQSFGLPLSFGGPLLGLIATKEAYLRNLPGRLIGRGKDKNGKDAYMIVVATREQHIKREKATSNICTNEALCALTASMYLSLYGKIGLRRLAETNMKNASLLKKMLSEIEGVSIPFSGPTFNEFVIRTKYSGRHFLELLKSRNIYGGIALSSDYRHQNPNDILVSVTEMNREGELYYLVAAIEEVMK